jgi:formamidopyrimidine-DNA glycosylase
VPELPEVETYRQRLEPRLAGKTLVQVTILDERLTMPRDSQSVAGALEGRRVRAVDRRGKYLLVRLVDGGTLVVHLRMTGGFPAARSSHERAVIDLDDGSRLVYRDVRRFGTWQLLDPEQLEAYLAARLGPEPLERGFTIAYLSGRLAGRRAPLKALVLDQRTVAGLGNIYADESLWHARLHPLRGGATLDAAEVAALRRGVRHALRRGIARSGSDLGDGAYTVGSMQDEFRVYGRDGEPCHRCRTVVVKTRVAGRGTHFCPACQR